MNTRLLVPLLALGAILFALGCETRVEMPATAETMPDEKPKGNELPQAPMPRVKKTMAELLIGKWKLVKINGKDVPLDWEVTREFQANGQYVVFAKYPRRPLKIDTGTYSVTGQIITFTRPAVGDVPGLIWEVKVDSLSSDEFSGSAGEKQREQGEYRRVVTK